MVKQLNGRTEMEVDVGDKAYLMPSVITVCVNICAYAF